MRADSELFQKVREGLIGAEPWSSPLEGAYTRVAKLAILNAFDARRLCDLLFGRRLAEPSFGVVHARSFLSATWTSSGRAKDLASWVQCGFLDRLCGRWAARIASDRHLRLCPKCADLGFQSSLFQIDGLHSCPIHGLPLVIDCPHCGEPTPPYALCTEAFRTPMQCNKCGRGYGAAWTGVAMLETWRGPRNELRLQGLADRLTTLSRTDIEWPTLGSWNANPMSDEPDQERRRWAFGSLQIVLHTPADGDVAAGLTCVTGTCSPAIALPLDRQREIAQRRTGIYKAIRRHLIRRLRLRPSLWHVDPFHTFHQHRETDAIVPQSRLCSPSLHALALWTTRFERQDQSPLNRWSRQFAKRPVGLTLHKVMLQWPGDHLVADSAWAQFVWYSFVEDWWTAQEWSRLTSPLEDPFDHSRGSTSLRGDESGSRLEFRRSKYLQLLRVWTPRLSPRVETWSSGFSHFIWRQGDGANTFCFVAVQRKGDPR